MHEFRISEEGIKKIRKIALAKSIPLSVLSAGVGIAVSSVSQASVQELMSVVPMMLVLVGGSIGLGIFLSIKRQIGVLRSYRLTFDDEAITREQNNTPTIRIPLSELRSWSQTPGGGYVISGPAPLVIIVPVQIENAPLLVELLRGINPMEARVEQKTKAFSILLPILVLACFAMVYVSSIKWIVFVCGTFCAATVIRSLVVAQKNVTLDRRSKHMMWIVLLPLISLIAMTIIKVLIL
jgi:hypothetical protein